MNLIDRFFKKDRVVESFPIDNKILVKLLDKWSEKQDYENYSNVMNELMTGSSCLFFSTLDDANEKSQSWKTLDDTKSIKLTCVFDVDGLKVVGVFTDEKALVEYTKSQTNYTVMRSQDALAMFEQAGIDRIVINSGQKNAFFTEKRQNTETQSIPSNATVLVSVPTQPLNGAVLEKLCEGFTNVSSIEEVYQYGLKQQADEEFNLVLGFRLKVDNDNARTAALNVIQKVLQEYPLKQSIDIFFITSDEWYNTIKEIENSLIYVNK